MRAGLGSESPGGLDVLELPCTQDLPSDEPGVPDPSNQCQREDHVLEARPEDRDERNRQQQSGKCQEDVHDPADRLVYIAAEIARNGPETDAHGRRDTDNDQADEQRDPRTGKHSRQDVATQLVETEPVRAGGPSRRNASSCADGSLGTSTGPTTAARTAMRTMTAPTRVSPTLPRDCVGLEASRLSLHNLTHSGFADRARHKRGR